MQGSWLGAVVALGILSVTSASAVTINVDFGSGAGITSSWPSTSNAGTNAAVALSGPLQIDGGILHRWLGAVVSFCQGGATVGTCGTATGLSGSNSYGLGVGDARVDAGTSDTVTLTLLNSGYTVKILNFSVAAFTAAETGSYSIDGGAATGFADTGSALDTFQINGGSGAAFTNTVVFNSTNGNYSLAHLTLDVTANGVPEPSTFALGSSALIGLAVFLRRKRK